MDNKETQKKNVCIIQFTRIGDILQTCQSITNVQKENLNFILVAREKFAAPIEAIIREAFDEIVYFNTKEIFKSFELDTINKEVEEFVSKINNKNIDLVVNLSFSPSSGYLSSLIESKIKFGLSYDSKNNITIPDKWSQYIYSNVLTGHFNSLSLVDLFSMIIGNSEVKTIDNNTKKTNNIIVHPFASTEKKRWKALKWSELIHHLFENNKDAKITLVGSPEERSRSVEILDSPLLFKYRNRINNLCGKTNLQELDEIVKAAQMFIGHDSMVGHLASRHQVQSLTISLGTVRPEESSPYGNRNLVFVPQTKCYPCNVSDSCETFDCHSDISYKVIGKFAIELLKDSNANYEDIASTIPKNLFYSTCRVFESTLTNANLYRLSEVTNNPINIKSVIQQVSRIVWLYFLEEKEEDNKLPIVDSRIKEEVKKYMNGISHLYELAEFGKKYSKYILEELSKDNPSTDNLVKFSKQLDEIDILQNALKKPYPEFSGLLDYFAVTRANTAGSSLVEITTNTFFIYNDASLLCSIFYELLEKVYKQNEQSAGAPVERN